MTTSDPRYLLLSPGDSSRLPAEPAVPEDSTTSPLLRTPSLDAMDTFPLAE